MITLEERVNLHEHLIAKGFVPNFKGEKTTLYHHPNPDGASPNTSLVLVTECLPDGHYKVIHAPNANRSPHSDNIEALVSGLVRDYRIGLGLNMFIKGATGAGYGMLISILATNGSPAAVSHLNSSLFWVSLGVTVVGSVLSKAFAGWNPFSNVRYGYRAVSSIGVPGVYPGPLYRFLGL
ncbi:hypothetical protein DRJ48_02950 [Candidatus Woesearchaeota archaeon]|nr:MAG: hypothetical protein DRJ48_02950 [Candidatus Woesearchaeota archaeon]